MPIQLVRSATCLFLPVLTPTQKSQPSASSGLKDLLVPCDLHSVGDHSYVPSTTKWGKKLSPRADHPCRIVYVHPLSLPFCLGRNPHGQKAVFDIWKELSWYAVYKKKKKNVPHASHPSICESCLLPCASKYPLTSTVLSIKTIVTSWWHHNYKMIRIFMAKPCVQKQQNSAIIQKYEMLLQFPWLLFRRQDNSALTGLYTTEGWEEKSVTLDCRK